MNKYNEIMEHIEISDEMRSRVIKNIEKHFEEKELRDGEIAATILKPPAAASKHASRRKWIKVIVVLAATMMICICPMLIMKNQTHQTTESSEPNQNTQDKEGYNKKRKREKTQEIEQGGQKKESIQELSEAVGFIVPEIDDIPFDVTNVEYLAKDGSAEIVYSGKSGNSLQFSMSREEEEVNDSQDHFEYRDVRIIKVLSGYVTILEETENSIFSVRWTDGEYVYSLNSEEGIDEDSVVRMVESLIKNK